LFGRRRFDGESRIAQAILPLDEFIEGHRPGTSFGNTLFMRYL
jgi:hypothetical protein